MSTCHTGSSAALTMYTVAFTMSQDTVDMLWWAIIGVTSQYIFHRVDYDHYFDNVGVLQDHVSRVSKRYVLVILSCVSCLLLCQLSSLELVIKFYCLVVLC